MAREAQAPMPRHDDISSMISVQDARNGVMSKIQTLQAIELPLQEAHGCILAEDVIAEADIPPFASSAMDGFAVRSSDATAATPESPVGLHVVGKAMIGQRPDATVGRGEAVRIATGAPIPAGADSVVPIEDCREEGDRVQILRGVPMGKHIRPAAEDIRAGDVLVAGGRRLSAPELGLLAAAGHMRASVHPRPRVVVFSTGDELVEPGKTLEFGKIHDSNMYTLFGQVKEAGAMPYSGGTIQDDVDELKEAVLSHLSQADVFISSGGVSVGERDVVKAAFFRRGDIDFYRVAMQPGMPQGFGLIEGKPYFGLPGNPVSVFVSFEVFIRPALLKMMGRTELERPKVTATLEGPISGPKEKTVFARVTVEPSGSGWSAAPTGGRGSNLLATVARANGLAIIPGGVERLDAGDEVQVMVFRPRDD
ncbi:MAG: gephyrin-like molybdotransferase Glp [Actinomycetota bacterium]